MLWVAGLEHEMAELGRAQEPDDNSKVRRGGLGKLALSILVLVAVLSIAGVSTGMEDGMMARWRWGAQTAHAQIQNELGDIGHTLAQGGRIMHKRRTPQDANSDVVRAEDSARGADGARRGEPDAAAHQQQRAREVGGLQAGAR